MENRSIKFRIWNEDYKKFVIYNEWGVDRPSLLLTRSGKVVSYTSGYGEEVYNFKYRICFYTGLKDKNGNEIYEGDVITLWISNHPTSSGKFEIVFKNGSFCLRVIKIDGIAGILFPSGKHLKGFDKNGDEIWKEDIINKCKSIFNYDTKIMEIVGNIFENPELLK